MGRLEMASVKERFDIAAMTGPEAKRSDEMQALFDWIIEQDKGMPDLNAMSLTESRPWRAKQMLRTNAEAPSVASVERISVPGHHGPDVTCDLVTPIDAEPGCMVYLHGGGWAFGDLNSHSRLAKVLATETRKRLLYVDYRLSPETPYPGPLDDSIAAWRWVAAKAESDPGFRGPLSISGDSAGGNLSVAVMLHELRAGRRLPDVALLFYGVYDDDVDTPSYLRFATGYGLARPGMMKFWAAYAPAEKHGAPRQDPLLCPVRADLADLRRLPPMYLNAAGLDPLMCDTIKFAERLEQAGAAFDVNVHAGVHHGFIQQTARLEESRRALRLAMEFYRRHERR
jgi:acetyl esterase